MGEPKVAYIRLTHDLPPASNAGRPTFIEKGMAHLSCCSCFQRWMVHICREWHSSLLGIVVGSYAGSNTKSDLQRRRITGEPKLAHDR